MLPGDVLAPVTAPQQQALRRRTDSVESVARAFHLHIFKLQVCAGVNVDRSGPGLDERELPKRQTGTGRDLERGLMRDWIDTGVSPLGVLPSPPGDLRGDPAEGVEVSFAFEYDGRSAFDYDWRARRFADPGQFRLRVVPGLKRDCRAVRSGRNLGNPVARVC